MKATLIKIQAQQLKRELGLGIVSGIVLFLILLLLSAVAYKVYTHPQNAVYLSVVVLLLTYFIHTARKDQEFVFRHIEPPRKNFFTEYFLFTLPLTFPCLVTKQWWLFILMALAIAGVSSIRKSFKRQALFSGISKILPAKDFEWISGCRKNFPAIALFLFLSYSLSWLRIAPLIFLWLLTSVLVTFYQECEPLSILCAGDVTSKQLLNRKLTRHATYLLGVYAPPLVINAVFNYELLWINVIFLLLQLSVLLLAILLKYTTYEPNSNFAGNSILLSFALIGSIIPFLFLIPVLMNFVQYGKALHKLDVYLDGAT